MAVNVTTTINAPTDTRMVISVCERRGFFFVALLSSSYLEDPIPNTMKKLNRGFYTLKKSKNLNLKNLHDTFNSRGPFFRTRDSNLQSGIFGSIQKKIILRSFL